MKIKKYCFFKQDPVLGKVKVYFEKNSSNKSLVKIKYPDKNKEREVEVFNISSYIKKLKKSGFQSIKENI